MEKRAQNLVVPCCCLFVFIGIFFISSCAPTASRSAAASYRFYHPMKPVKAWDEDLQQCEASIRALHESGRNLLEDKKGSLRHCMEAKGYVYDAPPLPLNVSFEQRSSNEELFPEYSIIESVWHSPELAEKRADYLRGTGLSGVSVSPINFGLQGTWFRVLVGSAESRKELYGLLHELRIENGLQHAKVIRIR